ncbi:MAG: TIGR02677 family protein [Streptosporangiales bacterium]|nr:TIGR02677 family protein [Streptosporangiales bacterium]
MPERDFTPFSYLTAPNAGLYRSVMTAFVQAKRRFTVHMRPEDVHESLAHAVESASLNDALARLVDWGNLRADADTSRVTSVEDFHRARYLFQLTRQGEAVEQAVETYDEVLGRRGALQAVALADIVTQLRALTELAEQPAADPAKVHLLLRGLVDRFTDLAGNAQAFMGSLQRTIDLHDADIDAFHAYKDRLIDYLERFIKDLVTTGSEIATLVAALEERGVAWLLDIAAGRESEDAAPGAGEDAADAKQVEFERTRRLWDERWHGFRAWFVSEPGHPSQAKLLRSQARAAIPQLLQVVATLNERRAGRSDRSADFRSLAGWFAEAPDDADLHRLWRAAFGLSSARHLTADSDGAAEPTSAQTAWADAPPLEISPRLRRTGSYERRGKPNRVVDRSTQRAHLAELAAREAAETSDARDALVTTHPTRLTDVGHLDPAAFRLFLGLLGDALAAQTPDSLAAQTLDSLAAQTPDSTAIETITSDGTMMIRLTPLDDGHRAEIHTPLGTFGGPDHLVEILDLIANARQEQSA